MADPSRMPRSPARPGAGRENGSRSAAELAEKVLRHYRVWSAVVAERVVRTWPRAVGARVAEHTRADRLVGSTLWVRVDSSAWLQELTLLEPALLAELRRELGEAIVEDLKLVLA